MNKLVFSMALLLAALGLPASGPVAAASVLEEPVPVFVSILPQKYFVERVGGGRVAVQVLVRPGENPETFEPNQRQMAALSRARIYFLAGVPFERVWAGRVLKAHPGLNVVRMHRSIDPEAGRENPHLWLNPNWVRKMAAVIRDVLIVADPAGLEDYTAGHDRFVRDLMALDREIRESLAPVSSRHFMVYHPAWLHFARCYDLDEIPIEFEGKAPGPKTLTKAIRRGRELGIKVIFVQKQFPVNTVTPIARALGARVVMIDPLAEDYLENLRRMTRALKEAMH